MGKLDPIYSEFDTEEDALASDAWFRAQVEAAVNSTEPDISHEQMKAEIREIIEKHGGA